MQLVPLSSDGRVTAVASASPAPGPLRVALEVDATGVGVVALGPGGPHPVAQLTAADAAAYRPVLGLLRARGLVGTCPARTAGRALVLHLAPAEECVLGNNPGDLELLAAERTVTVTRAEHHQDVLAGRRGRVAVAVRPCTIATGKHAGRRGVEVGLDGRRVGELTLLMAERYLPMIDEAAARGRRVGCEALLRPDHRGVQVELRLPAVDTNARPGHAAFPTTALPASVPSGAGGPGGSTALAGPRTRRSRGRVMWAGAAAVGVLVFAAAIGNGAKTDIPVAATAPVTTQAAEAVPAAEVSAPIPTTTTSAPPTGAASSRAASPRPATSRPATSRTASKATATTRTSTARARAGAAGGAAVAPTERTTVVRATPRPEVPLPPRSASARTGPTPPTRTTTTTTTEPEPTTTQPPPPPTRPRCDPNYSGACVPIASDVDCLGGGGDGPEYVKGPVRIIGKDIYDLDRGGEPGVGCE